MLGPGSTWTGDRLGTPGALGFLVFLSCLFVFSVHLFGHVKAGEGGAPKEPQLEIVFSFQATM
jgi:hypothetical protein